MDDTVVLPSDVAESRVRCEWVLLLSSSYLLVDLSQILFVAEACGLAFLVEKEMTPFCALRSATLDEFLVLSRLPFLDDDVAVGALVPPPVLLLVALLLLLDLTSFSSADLRLLLPLLPLLLLLLVFLLLLVRLPLVTLELVLVLVRPRFFLSFVGSCTGTFDVAEDAASDRGGSVPAPPMVTISCPSLLPLLDATEWRVDRHISPLLLLSTPPTSLLLLFWAAANLAAADRRARARRSILKILFRVF
mmetsp:Transcript_18376/g.40867  ORF Transcript_18376/g.40867 Transcript_18376/m.40867 type:complete len:248 (+) Transcript_18376:1600-2343(+)